MSRRVDEETVALIKQWEGYRPDAYLCPAGVWTIGYGTTGGVREGQRISQAEAERMLRMDLRRFENIVEDAVTVRLTDAQFGALVSLTYNIGGEAFRTSTLLRKLNAGDYAAVPQELMRWNRVAGRVSRGLTNRRAAEAGLWARGDYVSSRDKAPVAPPGEGAELAKVSAAAGAAATASPALHVLGGLPVWVAVAVVVCIAALAALYLLRRKPA